MKRIEIPLEHILSELDEHLSVEAVLTSVERYWNDYTDHYSWPHYQGYPPQSSLVSERISLLAEYSCIRVTNQLMSSGVRGTKGPPFYSCVILGVLYDNLKKLVESESEFLRLAESAFSLTCSHRVIPLHLRPLSVKIATHNLPELPIDDDLATYNESNRSTPNQESFKFPALVCVAEESRSGDPVPRPFKFESCIEFDTEQFLEREIYAFVNFAFQILDELLSPKTTEDDTKLEKVKFICRKGRIYPNTISEILDRRLPRGKGNGRKSKRGKNTALKKIRDHILAKYRVSLKKILNKEMPSKDKEKFRERCLDYGERWIEDNPDDSDVTLCKVSDLRKSLRKSIHNKWLGPKGVRIFFSS